MRYVCACSNFGKQSCTWWDVFVNDGIIWVTELVKLELAGLVPIFLYPAAGIVKAKVVAGKFWNGTSFLFCVGFLMGIVLERWNMHKRISMNMVLLAGNNVSLLLFMMMLAVYLLSMWISNTATILCMLPVVKSFLATVPEKHRPFKGDASCGGMVCYNWRHEHACRHTTNTLFLGIYEENWATNESFGLAHLWHCNSSIIYAPSDRLGPCLRMARVDCKRKN